MKAGIYARKSTDDNDRNEENKSVTRQVERARAYANTKGWTVDEEFIFTDDGVSGAEFENRPAFVRLIASLPKKGKPPFDVIVMSESSRLGRDMTRNAAFVVNIIESGVRIFYYLTDEEEKADTPEQRLMVTLKSYASEVERLKAGPRSYDALERKAAKGYNAGGVVYGYNNVHVCANGANGESVRSHTDYQINEGEAHVLRRIFEMYAAGHGHVRIARTLNRDPAFSELSRRYFNGQQPPSPRKGTGSWAPSSIRAMLYNERYTGIVPYGKYQKVYRRGTKARVKRDQKNVLRASRPDLRIIGEDLWARVQKRLHAARKGYLVSTGDELGGRPLSGRVSRYLLSGLMRCGCCGGSMVTTSMALGSGSTRRREPHYLCSWRHNRGSTVCANGHRVRSSEVDARVLSAIERIALTPGAVEYVIDKVVERVRATRRNVPDRLKTMDEELQRLKRELDRFLAFIAKGRALDSVRAEIETRERRIKELNAERDRLRGAGSTALDVAAIRRMALTRVNALRSTLYGNVADGREALRELLAGPITFKLEGSGYGLAGETRIGALFAPIPQTTRIRLASPRGFEPRFSP